MSNRYDCDVFVREEGSIILFEPVTVKGQDWMEWNLDPEAQKLGDSVVVEWRYANDIIDGMQADGLELGGI